MEWQAGAGRRIEAVLHMVVMCINKVSWHGIARRGRQGSGTPQLTRLHRLHRYSSKEARTPARRVHACPNHAPCCFS
jgi:hypothetical protein